MHYYTMNVVYSIKKTDLITSIASLS